MKKILFSLVAIIALFACEKDDDNVNDASINAKDACTLYPLEIGNYWVYQNVLTAEVDTQTVADTSSYNGETFYVLTSTGDVGSSQGLLNCSEQSVYQLISIVDSTDTIGNVSYKRNDIIRANIAEGDSWTENIEIYPGYNLLVVTTVKNINKDYGVSGFNFPLVIELEVETKYVSGGVTSPSTFVTRWIAPGVGLVKTRSQEYDGLNIDIIDYRLK